ncbi:CoA-binding protein [Gordonia oryzae]|uniref:CoA-binding protein n=1 Tax=Gordonia oryzae TaxID=2487349 RepID=A0A3N4GPC7_9ACTN|nr:acetate--CoA ligase family protein [Gordonia oryzae]RPA64773.1 CoA-binding protein [Gordonia oryzae]
MNTVLAPAHRLDRLLAPQSVAIVGASTTPGALGASVLDNLERGGFPGAIHLVNPRRPLIGDRQAVASIDELPEGIDCAILAVPGAAVLDAVRALAARRTGAVVIFSAGFAEGGEAGRAAQNELSAIASQSGMLVLGPNCLGLVNHNAAAALTFVESTIAPTTARERALGIVSQSGAMAAVLGVVVSARDIPISLSVSTGNEAATGVEDFVEHLVADDQTHVVLMLVEQFRDPQRFLAAAAAARRAGKTLVLLHPGTSDAARESAATHTGAMAGDHAVMATLVHRAGVIRVDTLEELADVGEIALRSAPALPEGPAVIGESGAFKALTLDLAERVGLPLPAVDDAGFPSLRDAVPDFVALSNPLDITAQGLVDPEIYRRVIDATLADPRFGSVIVNLIQTDERTTAIKIPPVLAALRAAPPTKPVIVAGMDEGAPVDDATVAALRELGVSYFPSPERVLRALARLTDAATGAVRPPKAAAAASAALPSPGPVIAEYRAKEYLASFGIPFPEGGFAANADEAVRLAERVGYPVVAKAQSAALSHKSDAGGVLLGLDDPAAVRDAWDRLHANVGAYDPSICLDGVLIETMGAQGIELIIGGRREPGWGPVLLIGFGGVTAELNRDVRLIAADLSADEVAAELLQLRGAPLLTGFRGSAPCDVDAVAQLVATLGSVMLAAEEITEIDLNPVVVRPGEQGATAAIALDALIITAPTAQNR